MVQTSEHRSDLGQWQTVQRAAAPQLRGYVHGYLASSSDLPLALQERHLPSPDVSLVVNLGAPHRRLDRADSNGWTVYDDAWVIGLHSHHQLATAMGERHFMVVRFTPIGAHLVLGLPMHLLANRAVELATIERTFARQVIGRVASAPSWTDRFTVMDTVIAERLAVADLSPSAGVAWHRLVAAGGRLSLGALASEVGCSHRTLIARFQRSVGLPPKTVARVLRFNRVLRALDRVNRQVPREGMSAPFVEQVQLGGRPIAVRWADLAADCGYADQAHLIRDFRQFAGDTPDAFLRHVSWHA